MKAAPSPEPDPAVAPGPPGDPWVRAGIFLLVTPAVGYAISLLLSSILMGSAVRDTAGPGSFLALIFTLAYYGLFFCGLLFGVPLGIVSLTVGILRNRRAGMATSLTAPRNRAWGGLAGVGIAIVVFALWKTATLEPLQQRFGDVAVGQTLAQVQDRLGWSNSANSGPCPDDAEVSCEEHIFYADDVSTGASSAWRLTLQLRGRVVVGGHIVGPDKRKTPIKGTPLTSARRR